MSLPRPRLLEAAAPGSAWSFRPQQRAGELESASLPAGVQPASSGCPGAGRAGPGAEEGGAGSLPRAQWLPHKTRMGEVTARVPASWAEHGCDSPAA